MTELFQELRKATLNLEVHDATNYLFKYKVLVKERNCSCSTGKLTWMATKSEPDGRMQCNKCKKRCSPRKETVLDGSY